ncbi:probable ubiquitin-conjugating enzyme E2 25 isoform X2 [Mercurialis annua]|uniref:probable ubiquitin-conjugating enzyme E2 25 isoform X2 n=1 Tax=Mercurialis annua TaxID=3986 RepID=UPI00215E3D0C|nr:probable ubiquitin-conjugating enzyme E2 25 isoform X2 [Mercurialis annua]
MQPPPPPPLLQSTQHHHHLHNPKSARKRAVMADMEGDVIEISPPPPSVRHYPHNNSQDKLKEAILQEVIDVDNDEDFSDVMVLGEKVDTKIKGKALEKHSDGYLPALDAAAGYPPKSYAFDNLISVDDYTSDMFYGSEFMDIYDDDSMEFDSYAYLQTHFDNVDVPAGVEAPFPCLLDSIPKTKNTVNGNDASGTQNQKDQNNLVTWKSKSSGACKKLSSESSSVFEFTPGSHASGADLSCHQSFPQISGSSATKNSSVDQLHKKTSSFGFKPNQWAPPPHAFHFSKQGGSGNPLWSNYSTDENGLKYFGLQPSHMLVPPMPGHPISAPPMPPVSSFKLKNASFNYAIQADYYNPYYGPRDLPEDGAARAPKHVNKEDILRKYQNFKRFDTVEDHSDNYYSSKGSSAGQPTKTWAKKIQDEWRILQNDLPDAIFVRAYESRMDLLRAVIIGAEGTPYHDGLFFFDVFFPSCYPNVPPNVYYHSGGLRLNPNLYNNGKVCLSLLGTWQGNKNEMWQPGVSTVLQVLVSIQALILNQKPFFNEPGFASMSGSVSGEKRSQQYNESTFMLSLKTMVYSMRRPPKYFEDFVLGHFHKYAHDILVACKAYMEGAQVGCLVKGGVQDVDEGDKSCSKNFKESLPASVDLLLKELSLNGVTDIEKFQILAKKDNNQAPTVPRQQ